MMININTCTSIGVKMNFYYLIMLEGLIYYLNNVLALVDTKIIILFNESEPKNSSNSNNNNNSNSSNNSSNSNDSSKIIVNKNV